MNIEVNRRSLLAGTGALTVSVLLPGQKARAQTIGAAARPPLDPRNLSSYVTIKADGARTGSCHGPWQISSTTLTAVSRASFGTPEDSQKIRRPSVSFYGPIFFDVVSSADRSSSGSMPHCARLCVWPAV